MYNTRVSLNNSTDKARLVKLIISQLVKDSSDKEA